VAGGESYREVLGKRSFKNLKRFLSGGESQIPLSVGGKRTRLFNQACIVESRRRLRWGGKEIISLDVPGPRRSRKPYNSKEGYDYQDHENPVEEKLRVGRETRTTPGGSTWLLSRTRLRRTVLREERRPSIW